MIEGNVNSQITDSVTQTIGAVLGNSPAETKSMLDTLMAETVGMAMYNAVTNQHNAQMVSNASMTAACARMLKTPFAAPPLVRLSSPTIQGVLPLPVPLPPTVAAVEIAGTGFSPDLTVEITSAGKKFAVLSGSAQLFDVTATSFSFSNALFNAEGSYGVVVRNPDGGASSSFALEVLAQAPAISAVSSCTGGVGVAGTNFQVGLTVSTMDAQGAPVPGGVVSAVTPTSFTVLYTPALTVGGLYGMTVTNPDGRVSPNSLFRPTS